MYPSGYPPQLHGEYTAADVQLGITAYKSALTSTHLPLGRKKQYSVNCLAQGQNEQTQRQGIEPGTWPRPYSGPLDQLATRTFYIYSVFIRT